jgi:hypothetical protein
MKRMLFALSAALLVSANSPPTSEPMTGEVAEEGPVGVWRIAKVTPESLIFFPESFYFDGQYLTTELLPMKASDWRTPDDMYRMQTVWRGNNLYFRLTFGGWSWPITFENGRFVERHDNMEIVYEKVAPGRLNEAEQLLIKKREPHDYRRTPLGDLEEQEDGGGPFPDGP